MAFNQSRMRSDLGQDIQAPGIWSIRVTVILYLRSPDGVPASEYLSRLASRNVGLSHLGIARVAHRLTEIFRSGISEAIY